MDINKEIVRWVEYSLCENTIIAYNKRKQKLGTFRSYCETFRTSIMKHDLSDYEFSTLSTIMHQTNRDFCLTNSEISTICANFFIDKKWGRYTEAIELMKHVNWRL